MTKAKYLIIAIFTIVVLFLIPSISNAAEISVTRNVYSDNGSMKFEFNGLTLDTTHEYEFGLTKTAAATVENWHLITEYTKTTATINIITTINDLRKVVNAVDKGYITIKDKTADTIVLEPYSVNLKIPFLKVTNYNVITNGKEFTATNGIEVALRNRETSNPYYQYEKITDTNVINKYKEIKAKNGNVMELENLLKTTVPTSNWISWDFWNGFSSDGTGGHGYTQGNISVPDTGLYYMWLYFSGKNDNLKNIYGYILVDNLQPDIALESISLEKTAKVELGKTLTLTPKFNPINATNKIVTWSSSDESVATIDNGGKITTKKVGSTIITVTSQDGSKKSTCTVTVVAKSGENNNSGTNNSKNNANTNNNKTNTDNTKATGKLPQTGISIGIIVAIVITTLAGVYAFIKTNKLRDI